MKYTVHTAAAVFFFSLSCLCHAQELDAVKKMDKRNLVTKEWNTDLVTNVKYLDHETVFDDKGKKIQETEYSKLGKIWTKKFEYGADGKVSRELTYNEHGRLDNIQTFEYNEFGRRSAVYTYDAKGKMVKVKVYEYSVLKNEN